MILQEAFQNDHYGNVASSTLGAKGILSFESDACITSCKFTARQIQLFCPLLHWFSLQFPSASWFVYHIKLYLLVGRVGNLVSGLMSLIRCPSPFLGLEVFEQIQFVPSVTLSNSCFILSNCLFALAKQNQISPRGSWDRKNEERSYTRYIPNLFHQEFRSFCIHSEHEIWNTSSMSLDS